MRLPVIAQVGRIAPEDRAKLAVFLADAPLYTSLDIPGTWLEQDNVENIVPAEIQHPCESTKCEDLGTPSWKLAPLAQNITPGFCGGLLYLCRNCEAPFHVWFFWKYASTRAAEDIETINRALRIGDAPPLTSKPAGRFIFEKVGQLPPLSVKVPRELQKALGAQAALYRRAIIARNMGHGIGAHAYFRRVVEETMDEMLTMLVATLVNDGADKGLLRRVESAKAGRVFEKKAEIAADALPKRLRPGGLNPFGSLHDLLSTNLHSKTDEECIRVVDRMRNDLDIIFKILKVHVSDHSEYVEAAKRLQQQNDPGQKERT